MSGSKHEWVDSTVTAFKQLSGESGPKLYETSSVLLQTLYHALQTSTQSMLPTYTTSLPESSTTGTAVAIDLGGSTLRVLVIKLQGNVRNDENDTLQRTSDWKVLVRNSWPVEDEIKRSKLQDFFDWIADCVRKTITEAKLGSGQGKSVGVTWSFPVTQTSPASGNVIQMGKGYVQWQEAVDTDLKSHFEAAFARIGLDLHMNALVNDTEATLLWHAFANPSTSMSLILGTGLNVAAILPLSAFPLQKLGDRPKEWLQVAKVVLINTEISMFGSDVFPITDADRVLDSASNAPGFQPLEKLTSGRYLGEIFRLTLEEGVKAEYLFDGVVPVGLITRFGLDTGDMATIEACTIEEGTSLIWRIFESQQPPTAEDVEIIRSICRAISERAAIYIGVMLFSIWRLQRDTMFADEKISQAVSKSSGSIAIAYCGGVIEKHPTLQRRCQEILDLLIDQEARHSKISPDLRLILERAGDSSLLGVAVASMMNFMDER